MLDESLISPIIPPSRKILGLKRTNQKHKSHHSLNNPVLGEGSLKFNVGILKECIRANILRYKRFEALFLMFQSF